MVLSSDQQPVAIGASAQITLSSVTNGDAIMDKDRIQGSLKQVVGGIKEAVGKAAGKFQNAVGSLKDTVRETFKR